MKPPNNPDLAELFAFASKTAEVALRRDGDDVPPSWHVVCDDGSYELIDIAKHLHENWNDWRTRAIVADWLRLKFKDLRVVRYVQLLSMWYIALKPESLDEVKKLERYFKGVGLSNHPARQEGVLVSGECHQAGSLFGILPIIRKPNTRPRLGPINTDIPDLVATEGRFTGLLPVETKPN
jgi:hypothetical protein